MTKSWTENKNWKFQKRRKKVVCGGDFSETDTQTVCAINNEHGRSQSQWRAHDSYSSKYAISQFFAYFVSSFFYLSNFASLWYLRIYIYYSTERVNMNGGRVKKSKLKTKYWDLNVSWVRECCCHFAMFLLDIYKNTRSHLPLASNSQFDSNLNKIPYNLFSLLLSTDNNMYS